MHTVYMYKLGKTLLRFFTMAVAHFFVDFTCFATNIDRLWLEGYVTFPGLRAMSSLFVISIRGLAAAFSPLQDIPGMMLPVQIAFFIEGRFPTTHMSCHFLCAMLCCMV